MKNSNRYFTMNEAVLAYIDSSGWLHVCCPVHPDLVPEFKIWLSGTGDTDIKRAG